MGSSPKKEYIESEYPNNLSLVSSIESLIKGEKDIEKNELRKFFISYFDKECGIKLKSKKLYLDIIDWGKLWH